MSEREINRASPANDDAPVRLPTRRAFRPTSADVGREHTHPHTQREKKKKKKPSSSSISISTYTHKKTGRVSPRRAPSLPSPRSRALPARRSRRPVCAVRFPASRGARRFNARLDRASARSRSRTASSRRTRDPRGILTDSGDDATTRRGAAPLRASGYKPSRHDPAIDFFRVEYEVVIFMLGMVWRDLWGMCEGLVTTTTGRVIYLSHR